MTIENNISCLRKTSHPVQLPVATPKCSQGYRLYNYPAYSLPIIMK